MWHPPRASWAAECQVLTWKKPEDLVLARQAEDKQGTLLAAQQKAEKAQQAYEQAQSKADAARATATELRERSAKASQAKKGAERAAVALESARAQEAYAQRLIDAEK